MCVCVCVCVCVTHGVHVSTTSCESAWPVEANLLPEFGVIAN